MNKLLEAYEAVYKAHWKVIEGGASNLPLWAQKMKDAWVELPKEMQDQLAKWRP